MGAQKALYLGLINSIVGRAFEDKSNQVASVQGQLCLLTKEMIRGAHL